MIYQFPDLQARTIESLWRRLSRIDFRVSTTPFVSLAVDTSDMVWRPEVDGSAFLRGQCKGACPRRRRASPTWRRRQAILERRRKWESPEAPGHCRPGKGKRLRWQWLEKYVPRSGLADAIKMTPRPLLIQRAPSGAIPRRILALPFPSASLSKSYRVRVPDRVLSYC